MIKTANDELSREEKIKILIDKLKQPSGVLNQSLPVKLLQKSDDVFRIVVVGEFSRGKSTFINALLGQRLLPTNKRPTTAVSTIVKYGDTLEYRVYRKGDNASLKISQDEFFSIGDYFSDDHLLDFSFIDHAEVSCPLPFCKDNVEVVDTPGTNDLNVGRMEITYNFINTADAVILLLSAYMPLSMSEKEFLKEQILGNQIKDIFFVISHKDALESPDTEKNIVNFITKELCGIFPVGFNLKNRLFLVDSRGALLYHMKERGEQLKPRQEWKIPINFNDTGFPAVEKALKDLICEKQRIVKRTVKPFKPSMESTPELSSVEMYKKGLFCEEKKNYQEAMKWYRKAADAGNAGAMFNIGVLSGLGEGVTQNYAEAMKWYRMAAEAGDAVAMGKIGAFYEEGRGVRQDYTEAVKWYHKAADAGNKDAKQKLAELQTLVNRQQTATPAPSTLSSEEMYQKGYSYFQQGNYEKAMEWYKKAVNAGHIIAIENIGNLYYNGRGVEQDYLEAFRWFRRAADQGCASAMVGIGFLYQKGNGVKQDYAEAMKWYRKAADANYADALLIIGSFYENGYGVKQDYAEAVKWYRKAADSGSVPAMRKLGRIYENGVIVKQDYVESIKWYRKAVTMGDTKTKEHIKKIQRKIEAQKAADNKKSSGCFITTAVCDSFNKPDNCYELTTFRNFRDSWLVKQSDGVTLINEYYNIAPTIVKNINLQANAGEIYRRIWQKYLLPCLRYIESGDNLRCKELYISMVNALRSKFAPN